MKRVYGIEPKIKHYGCMVDLLGRWGRILEAEELIKGMVWKPDVVIWGALLSACKEYILQNPHFELPPSNWNANSTAPLFPLDENSTIPGWTFAGAVQYATAGADLSLPRDGHAILLGQDGKINQAFTANGDHMQYVLTFTLVRGVQNCTSNASLVVSAPDKPWEVYGHQLGSWGGGESINLVIQSQAIDAAPNSTCWPVVDALSLITIGSLNQETDNLLPNGGFELGPAFPEFSNDGVLLDSEPSLIESALQQWTVLGTVKYINTKSYFAPEDKAAVEIVSGVSAGVQTAKVLTQGFNGTGSAKKYSLTFKGAGPSPTTISFQSYTTRQREDGVFCGPVIDAVVLRDSSGHKSNTHSAFLIALLLVAFLKISELL
ncbi:hypothetical protein Pfo_014499 [Paulownia fortunei]|nr:hypothetical protein Pfo_014499 [Paulownia fortunei]